MQGVGPLSFHDLVGHLNSIRGGESVPPRQSIEPGRGRGVKLARAALGDFKILLRVVNQEVNATVDDLWRPHLRL